MGSFPETCYDPNSQEYPLEGRGGNIIKCTEKSKLKLAFVFTSVKINYGNYSS